MIPLMTTDIPPMIAPLPAMERMRLLRESMGEIRIGITPKQHHQRIDYALSLGLHSMAHLKNKCEGERIAVVGSGPSLTDSIPYLKTFQGKIMAVNGAHDELLKHGIKPTFGVLLDPHDWVATYQTPTEGVVYLIASTVHPKVWQRFLEHGVRPWLFIPLLDDTEHVTLSYRYADNLCFVAGATTVGLRALNIVMHLGGYVAECHGFDSCYPPGNDGTVLHAHDKPYVLHNHRPVTLRSDNMLHHKFTCLTNDAMGRQIIGFNGFIQNLPYHECNGHTGKFRVVVAGDGAIPWMAWRNGGPGKHVEHLNPAVMEAKYGAAMHWDYQHNKPKEAA